MRPLVIAGVILLTTSAAWARVGIVVGPVKDQWAAAVQRLLPAKLAALPPWEELGLWRADRLEPIAGPGVVARLRKQRLGSRISPGPLGKGLEAALKWAGVSGRVVLITPRLPRVQAGLQLVLVGGRPASGAWVGVAHPAPTLRALAPALTRAIRWATSSSRLVVLAHDSRNRPLTLRWEATGPGRCAGVSGKELVVAPGVYRIKWVGRKGPPLPQAVGVGTGELKKVWAGGWGWVVAEGLKEAKGWKVAAISLATGQRPGGYRRLPARWKLTAGRYLLRVLAPPLTWQVEVRPGKSLRMALGRPTKVVVEFSGKCRKWRVGLVARQNWPGGRTIRGAAGIPMRLLPGPYIFELDCQPRLSIPARLRPGETMRLKAPAVGWVALGRGCKGPWWIIRGRRRLGITGPGRGVWLVPGKYRLVPVGGGRGMDIRVGACERILLSPDFPH